MSQVSPSSVDVRPVSLPKDAETFIDVWFDLYRDNPHWVAPLRFERKDFLNPAKNPYFKLANIQCFIAWKDGRPVGTISAQVDTGYQLVERGVGFFGFFEFPNDPAVARALLDTAHDWLRGQGMTRMMGPFSFNTNHECGLLVDAFDSDPLVLMTYNLPYYPTIYDGLGLTKAKDLYAYWLVNDGPVPERIGKLADRVVQKYPQVKFRPFNPKMFEQEVAIARDIYNDAWADNWGFVRLTDEEFAKVAEGLKPMIDPRYCYVAEVDGKAIAFSITLPDYNQVVKPMKGRIFPFGWWYWLTMPKKISQIRVFALGVRREWQHLPLGAPLYKMTWDAGRAAGVTGAECSWILEDNTRMRGALEKLGGRISKTYRIYQAEI